MGKLSGKPVTPLFLKSSMSKCFTRVGIKNYLPIKSQIFEGGSSGLVIMGDNSCLKGYGFESWHCIHDGHFFTLICFKQLNCLFEKTENKRKNYIEWSNGPKSNLSLNFIPTYNLKNRDKPIIQVNISFILQSRSFRYNDNNDDSTSHIQQS